MLQYLVFLAEINWVLWIYFSLHNLLLIFCIFLSCFLDFASAWFTIQLFFYCCICLFISLSSNPGSWANVLSLSNSLSLWYFKYTTFNFSIFLAMKCRSFFILKLCPGILLNSLINSHNYVKILICLHCNHIFKWCQVNFFPVLSVE